MEDWAAAGYEHVVLGREHWVPHKKAEEVNQLLVDFIRE